MSKLVKEEFIIQKSRKWAAINLTAIEDPNLSPKAKFIHTYLVSRPEGWEIRINDIIKRSTVGRDSIYSGLKELIDKKYVYRSQKRDKDGRMGKITYLVHLEPNNSPLPEKPEAVEPGAAKPHTYYNNNINSDQFKKNASHSTGIKRSQKKTLEYKSKPKPLKIKIRLNTKRKPLANNKANGKIFDSSFESENSGNYLAEYQIKQGFGKSSYSPILRDRYNQLRKRGIPVDTKNLETLVEHWNSYIRDKGEVIKLRKGIKLPMHTLKLNKSLFHLQTAITYMTKINGYSTEQLLTGIDNFLGLYLNGHSYSRKTNLIGTLTLREKTFLKCLDGSIKKMANFYPIPKEDKNLKYFRKKSLQDLYANNGGRKQISPEEEAYARGRGAEIRYEQYLINNTNLTGKEIDNKIMEERKLLN